MKFFENTMGIIALICICISVYQIISTSDYTPTNIFILGASSALFAAVFKAMNDSRARDRYNLLHNK